MSDTSHLVALEQRLSRERERLKNARSSQEVAQRTVYVQQAEKEVASERDFLGLAQSPSPDLDALSDDELLQELKKP